MHILFEDEHIIVINKASGMASQASAEKDGKSSIEILAYKLGHSLFPVHRIDQSTSGLLLFAKHKKSANAFSQLFVKKLVEKKYYAIVKGDIKCDEACLIHYIKKSKGNKMLLCDAKDKKGQKAMLEYKVLHTLTPYTLLKVNLFSGRQHQIRVQLGAMNLPIVGDNKYGYKRANRDRSICLHAFSLNLTHPFSKEKISLIAPIPEDDFWKKFF